MGKFKQLTLEEREHLYLWRNLGISFREIGRRLKKDHGGLIKEWQRNSRFVPYLPACAQLRAQRKSRDQRRRAPLKSIQVWEYVQEHLRAPYFWTPEQIAGRLSLEYPTLCIHHETIYRYIYSKEARLYKLWQYLPNRRKKRMKKGGRTVHHRGKIPGAISIDMRPVIVAKRLRVGDYETDNVIGRQSDTTALSVTIERYTRFSMIDKLPNRTAAAKREAVTKRLLVFPQRIRLTLTQDNGTENTQHQLLGQETGLDVFFAHAYHAWEKGSNENTNGRIRRFIPKRVSIDQISEQKIKEIEHWLNNTPRKCLGYLTPYEKMQQVLKSFKYP
ncbi:MAG: IS30 family transposase [Patescibacteria group bacterium]